MSTPLDLVLSLKKCNSILEKMRSTLVSARTQRAHHPADTKGQVEITDQDQV
jgi:hypothetical protein